MGSHAWTPRLFAEPGNPPRCPAADYIKSETDSGIRAKIIAKIYHLARIGRDDAGRPLVDTLDGKIKELRVDKQIRLLFSWEDDGVLLILGGTRKKNGKVDPQVVVQAKADRDHWLSEGSFATMDQLKKLLKV